MSAAPADWQEFIAQSMSEQQLLINVRLICGDLGLTHYHTHDSRGSEPGFPDSVIIGKRIIYRELKSQNGRLSRAQERTGKLIIKAGGDWAIWRPLDLLNERIRQQLEAIAK